MKNQSIFSEDLLSHYILDFRLSSVTGIREKTLLIKELVAELDSGKIKNAKEEEFKSRFINIFFGDILGFNYGNSNEWQLRLEKKSTTDGTKPDAVLGFFGIDSTTDDVRALIEIKDAKTDLDEKQKRPNKQTTLQQAFEYASKTAGGNCQWVIVSNINEIRFYPSLDQSKYQSFFLKDLIDENKFKELIFLFHKDRFIKKTEKSYTDKLFDKSKAIQINHLKPIHIIDIIHNRLKQFDGLGFIDPNYISTISPFNILDEYVWHYEDRTLFTLNPKIFELLSEIVIENGGINFSEKLLHEIRDFDVLDALHKMEWIFDFLRHCLIDNISAVKDYSKHIEQSIGTIGFTYTHPFHFKQGEEGVTKNIILAKSSSCDCLICNYRSLNFNHFLNKLKTSLGNPVYNTFEYSYGHYLAATNNFKSTYSTLKAIEQETKIREKESVKYFLAKQNIKLLQNLILNYHLDDSKEIMNNIKSVDLDKVIYDEIEFEVDKEVKDYLISIKEDNLIFKLQDEIDELLFKIEKLKLLYQKGGKQDFGPNLSYLLINKYLLLYLHVNRNYIIYDTFKRYKTLAEKTFKGLVISHQTPEFAFKSFNDFLLTEAILHIYPTNLQEILKDIELLVTQDGCIEILLNKLENFTSSYFTKYQFGPVENVLLAEQLTNFRFKDRYTDIFSNLFSILSRLDISINQFNTCKKSLLIFLKMEKELVWYDLQQFSYFLTKKGILFEAYELIDIFQIAINKKEYYNPKYDNLINNIPKVLLVNHPANKIDNEKLIKTAILKFSSDNGKVKSYHNLIPLLNICNEPCKKILLDAFQEYLNEKFDSYFYEELLRKSDFDYTIKDYFLNYSNEINNSKGRSYKYGQLKLTDTTFINYIFILYKRQIPFESTELTVFTNLNEFEKYLLNPNEFDYSKFKSEWLIDLYDTIMIDTLIQNPNVGISIDNALNEEFNPILAELKYKYFKPVS